MKLRSAALLPLALIALSRPARADPRPPQALGTFALRLNPLAVLAQLDLRSSRAPFALVGHAAWRTVSLELGVGPSWVVLGGFLTFTVQATAEPGYFLTVPRGATLAEGRRLSDPDDRRRGLRVGAMSMLGLNLRVGRFWLYSRDTLWARVRAEPEYDRVTDAVVDAEVGFEAANALMFDLAPRGDRHWWLYAEHTHAWIGGLGTVVARPSIGLIVEGVIRRVALDFDVNYGLREGPLAGLGAIALVWVSSD